METIKMPRRRTFLRYQWRKLRHAYLKWSKRRRQMKAAKLRTSTATKNWWTRWRENLDSNTKTPLEIFVSYAPIGSGWMYVHTVVLAIAALYFLMQFMLMETALCAAAVLWMLSEGFKIDIPSKPAHIGLMTVWGVRTGIVLSEGKHYLGNYFPFWLSAIPIDVTPVNQEMPFENISTIKRVKDAGDPTKETVLLGPPVKVTVAILWEPDKGSKHVMEFTQVGERDGVKTIFDDIVGRIVRELGTRVTLEEYARMKIPLAVYIATRLTNLEISYRVDPNAPDDESNRAIIADPFQTYSDPKDQLLHIERLSRWLDDLNTKGAGNIPGLGVQVKRINVKDIIAMSKDLRDAIDNVAKEDYQREAELKNAETIKATADKLKDMPPHVIQAALLNNGKIEKMTVSVERREIVLMDAKGNPIDPALAPLLTAAAVLPQNKT